MSPSGVCRYKNASTKRGIIPSNFNKFDVKVAFERGITNKIVKEELSFLLSQIALLTSMLYSKYEVNRKSTFKVIGNIKFHVKVAFERDITHKIVKEELSFLLSRIALFTSMLYSKYEVNRKSTFKVIGHIKFHVQAGGLPDDADGQ